MAEALKLAAHTDVAFLSREWVERNAPSLLGDDVASKLASCSGNARLPNNNNIMVKSITVAVMSR